MHSVGTLISTFLRDKRGSSITLFAAATGLILGLGGLAVDLGFLYSAQNQLQVSADTAALAAIDRLPDVNDARTQATAFVETNMPSSKYGTVLATADFNTGNWDDSTSTFTDGGTPLNAVQVTVRRSQANGNAVNMFFGHLLGHDTSNLAATAIAVANVQDDLCMLALDPTMAGAITMSGDSEVDFDGCGVGADSNDPQAISLTGDCDLTVQSLTVVGDYSDPGSCLDSQNAPETGSSATGDPFASLDVPSFSGCGGGTNLVVSSDQTLSPGVYCGDLTITNDSDVDLLPGEYIIDGGDLVIEDESDLEGTGVVIFLTSSTVPADIGSLRIIDDGDLDITAPTTGPYAAITMFQDRDAPTTGRNEISGGGEPELEANGILYFPSQELYVDGEGEVKVEEDGCIMVIARSITLTDDAEVDIECTDGAIGAAVGQTTTRLRG